MNFKFHSASKPLFILGVAMIPLFLLFAIGIFADARIVTGAPVWLKPAKFALSIAIYCLTLAWLLGYISPVTRRLRWLAWTITTTLAIEIAIIGIQAGRGTTSHFNSRTTFDTLLFTIMGIAIAILLIASIGITINLFRQQFTSSALGWALRLGMAITVVGSASGGLMLAPVGAHTVGAPDGGPGLPGTGWSRQHGDLRVPHFIGLHAVQALSLLALMLSRMRRLRTQTIIVAAASYFGLFVILTTQALHGQSIVTPDNTTWTILGLWLTATLAGLAITWRKQL